MPERCQCFNILSMSKIVARGLFCHIRFQDDASQIFLLRAWGRAIYNLRNCKRERPNMSEHLVDESTLCPIDTHDDTVLRQTLRNDWDADLYGPAAGPVRHDPKEVTSQKWGQTDIFWTILNGIVDAVIRLTQS